MRNATGRHISRTDTGRSLLETLRWKTVDRYWVADADGSESFVCLQRHRLLPWKGRRKTFTFDDRMVVDA